MTAMKDETDKHATEKKTARKPLTVKEFGGKPLWDWLQLLIVPLVLAAIGFWFTASQEARQQQIEDQRAQQAQNIENKRAQAERELAEQRAQDEALQAYLDQMSTLILDWKLGEDEQCFTCHRAAPLAQARTSTVILRLDAKHNESVTRFLSTSKLTWSSTTSPIPGFREFPEGLLSGIVLSDAKLSSAFLPNADLNGADLSGADLSNAILTDADLGKAILSGADLSGAYMSGADLSGAERITNEELEQQASSLKGATMPNGQKYEDWLKSKGKGEKGISEKADKAKFAEFYFHVLV
jgi:multidrug efflux pump subunit AcrA (membrane-fusion protein)